MVDPITVIEAASAVLKITSEVVKEAVSFKVNGDHLGKRLDDLINELRTLRRAVHDICTCLKTPSTIQAVRAFDDDILGRLYDNLDNCSRSIREFGDLFCDLDPYGTQDRPGFFRRGVRAKKLELRSEGFLEIRQKIGTHLKALQISLLSILVYALPELRHTM